MGRITDYIDNDESIVRAVAVAIVTFLLIALICFACNVTATESEEPQFGNRTLVLDCSNAAIMHKYGMPSAEDAMNYKKYGSWGYKASDDKTYIFNHLPGEAEAWYELYGI